WSLTGLWHGADWKFALWGVCFFVLLATEKYLGLGKWMTKRWIGHIYAMAAVTVVTVFIRASTMDYALGMIGAMFGFGGGGFWDDTATMYVREYGWYVLAALIVALPVGNFLQSKLRIPDNAMQILRGLCLAAALFASITSVVMGGYNPFIYFNF
ncbi:MAG: MBOAT family protein, partial [Clostridia bacterium]|nr:MBOAT family protein [Clostridia bacterium]